MNSIENMLCVFCKNSTIISTDKPSNYDFNSSNEDKNNSSLFSICTTCSKYSYINEGTLLYNEVLSKNSSKLIYSTNSKRKKDSYLSSIIIHNIYI